MKRYRDYAYEMVKEYGKVISVCVSCILISIACVILIRLWPHDLTVSFLDIGQGDAILIQTPSGKSMLVDGGPSNIVLERMSHTLPLFTHDIDVIVSTHPDSDHVTGLIPVLENYDVPTIVVSPHTGTTELFKDFDAHVAQENADVHVGYAGDVIDFHDGVTATILYPMHGYKITRDTNDASVSIFLSYGEESFLLTGDLPTKDETYLLQGNKLPKHITVYKAGHHGSKGSSGEQLLSCIRPEYAVISAGNNNTYGHPHKETITRLQTYAKEILSTIDKGSISFVTNGRMLNVLTEK